MSKKHLPNCFQEECELPQMHMLSVAMGPILHKSCPPNCQDMLAWLPHHVALHVLSFIDSGTFFLHPIYVVGRSVISRPRLDYVCEKVLGEFYLCIPVLFYSELMSL